MSETISLEYPIEANGVTVNSLNLRRPTIGDLLKSAADGRSNREAEIHLFADLCGISPEDIQRIDLKDFFKLQEALGKMRGTSRKSSAKA